MAGSEPASGPPLPAANRRCVLSSLFFEPGLSASGRNRRSQSAVRAVCMVNGYGTIVQEQHSSFTSRVSDQPSKAIWWVTKKRIWSAASSRKRHTRNRGPDSKANGWRRNRLSVAELQLGVLPTADASDPQPAVTGPPSQAIRCTGWPSAMGKVVRRTSCRCRISPRLRSRLGHMEFALQPQRRRTVVGRDLRVPLVGKPQSLLANDRGADVRSASRGMVWGNACTSRFPCKRLSSRACFAGDSLDRRWVISLGVAHDFSCLTSPPIKRSASSSVRASISSSNRPFDDDRLLGNRRRVEKVQQCQVDAECLAQAGNESRGQDRVAAQVQEALFARSHSAGRAPHPTSPLGASRPRFGVAQTRRAREPVYLVPRSCPASRPGRCAGSCPSALSGSRRR